MTSVTCVSQTCTPCTMKSMEILSGHLLLLCTAAQALAASPTMRE